MRQIYYYELTTIGLIFMKTLKISDFHGIIIFVSEYMLHL